MPPKSVTPVFNRLPHSEAALEKLALQTLHLRPGLLPSAPGEISIERVIESMFGFNETYDRLDTGILGETHFGIENRPLRIRISRHLAELNSDPGVDHERRETLAHECGHCLAHGQIYSNALAKETAPRLPGFDGSEPYYACRDTTIAPNGAKPRGESSSHEWLEWEANSLMASLLLPMRLVQSALTPWIRRSTSGFAPTILPTSRKAEATAHVSGLFNVSFQLAEKRIDDLLLRSSHPDLFTRSISQ